jgi:group I intron endonuclease
LPHNLVAAQNAFKCQNAAKMKSNKELREEYKQKKFKIGVFQIRNTVNGKIFIGSSVDLDAIWNRHKSELKLGGHRNKPLQNEWTQFGEGNFQYEILSELEQVEGDQVDYKKEARKLEEMFIEDLAPFADKGYHTLKG